MVEAVESNKPKQQHYVPVVLQERFVSRSGKLCVIRRGLNVIWESKPSKNFKQSHLYSAFRADGTKDFSLETFYAEQEGKVGIVLAKIVDEARNGSMSSLSLEERQILIEFIHHLWRRTPDVTDRLFPAKSDEEARATILRAMQEKNHQLSLKDQEELLVPGNAQTYLHNGRVSILRRDSAALMETLSRLKITVVRVPESKGAFVIGSYPVLAISPADPPHLGSAGSELWLPIAKDIALCLADADYPAYRVATQQLVRIVNLRIAGRSSMLASRSEYLLRSLVKVAWDRRLDPKHLRGEGKRTRKRG